MTATVHDGNDIAHPINPTCPACGGRWGGGDFSDGEETNCRSCDATLVLVVFEDDTARMLLRRRPPLTAKQRTRRLWNKRGRR